MQEKADKDDKHIVHATQHQSKEVSINIEDMKQLMYMDQTGKILVVSSQGNQYIMVMCKVDSKFINSKLMKDRSSTKLKMWK